MADQPVTIEKLVNADKDFQTIEDFIKKPKDETVTTRFGDEIMTLKGLEEEVKKSGGYFRRYATLDAANVDIANIPVDAVVKVTSAVDGGDYEKVTAGVTSLTKSAYDPLTQAKDYTDNALPTTPLENLFNAANEKPGLNINPADGKIRASTDVSLNVFAVDGGKKYKLKTKTEINKSYVVMGVASDNSAIAGKTTTLIPLVDTSDPLVKEFTVPSGFAFAFINTLWGFVSVDIRVDTIVATQINYVVKKIKGAPVYDENANNRASHLEKNAVLEGDIELSGTDYYSLTNEKTNLYVNRTSGLVASYTTSSSVVFPVEAGKTYYIDSPAYLANAAIGLSNTDNITAGMPVTIVYLEAHAGNVMKFTVPADSTKLFAVFTTALSSQSYNVKGQISIRDKPEAIHIVKIKGIKVAEMPENTINPLYNLKWAVIGDSITEKNFRTNKNYHEYVAESVGGMTIYNYGISGTAWTGRTLVPAAIKDQVINGQIQEPDLFTVFLGTNDFGVNAKPLGVFGDITTDTVAGGIYALLNNLITEFPTKPIGVFTPLPRYNSYGLTGGTPNQYGVTLLQICEMIKKHCNHFGIPCLDLYFESNLYVFNADANQYYFTAPSYSNPDGVHPNDLGHQVIAKKIQKFLESI